MEVSCSIKKQSGRLVLKGNAIHHTPDNQNAPPEVVNLADIQGMQATPPTAAKMRIKLTAKDGKTTMLEFANPSDLTTARNELQAALKAVRESSSEPKTESPVTAEAQPGSAAKADSPFSATGAAGSGRAASGSGNGPAGGPAGGVANGSKSRKQFSLDPEKLLRNLPLQRSILDKDPELKKLFEELVIKSNALTHEQFWALRIQRLAVETQDRAMTRGGYNVLSTIKMVKSSDNKTTLNISVEKINALFEQYPVLRKAHSELVPPMENDAFWMRFFTSKLYLVLKGERVPANHAADKDFDKYVDLQSEYQKRQRARLAKEDTEHPAPLFMNVETNADNNPETYGNNIVTTGGQGPRGLIRTMNGLSQKLLLGKRKDREIYGSSGSLEKELRLNDLASEQQADDRVALRLYAERSERDGTTTFESRDTAQKIAASVPSHISLEDIGSETEGLKAAQKNIEALAPNLQTTTISDSEADVSAQLLETQRVVSEALRQFWRMYNVDKSKVGPLRDYLIKSVEHIHLIPRNELLGSLIQSVEQTLSLPIT